MLIFSSSTIHLNLSPLKTHIDNKLLCIFGTYLTSMIILTIPLTIRSYANHPLRCIVPHEKYLLSHPISVKKTTPIRCHVVYEAPKSITHLAQSNKLALLENTDVSLSPSLSTTSLSFSFGLLQALTAVATVNDSQTLYLLVPVPLPSFQFSTFSAMFR